MRHTLIEEAHADRQAAAARELAHHVRWVLMLRPVQRLMVTAFPTTLRRLQDAAARVEELA